MTGTNGQKPNKLINKRTFAFTLDLFLIILINKAIMLTYMSTLNIVFYHLPVAVQKNLIEYLPHISFHILLLVFGGYFFFSYFLGEGKTPGKLLFNLKVQSLSSNDKELSFKECFLRTAGYFVCYLTGLILFAIPYFNKKGTGLPDFLSSTQVIDETAVVPALQVVPQQDEETATTEDIAA